MKKLIIISFLVLLTNISFGQKYLKYYKKGVELFKQERFKEADSLFSLAINKLNDKTHNLGANFFFDRGITRFYLLDTSGFCSDMKESATTYKDREAEKNYKQYCLKYHENANEFYKQGLHEFNIKNYKASDSLLTISIESYAFVDNIFLRGIANLYMQDTNSFCSDMLNLSYINAQANQNYQQICKPGKSNKLVQDEEFYVDLDEEYEEDDEIFFVVENMPKFNNGSSDAFRIYIQQNLRYPLIAVQKGISGRVFVQFDVYKTGEVKNVIIVKSANEVLDNEALRVVRSSPRWSPGSQRGKPVTVRFTFPIVFQLTKSR